MNPIEFRKRLTGGLNKSTNLNEVPPTDFIDGYDIVDNTPKAYNEKGLLQPCSNTKFAYDLGEATAQGKLYKVTMNLTGLANCNLLFRFQVSGLLDATASIVYPTGTNAVDTLALIQAGFGSNAIINTISSSGFILIFDVQFVNLGYTDYLFSVSNSLGDIYETTALRDAVSVEKAGIFYPSCFANINNDQQIFATTNTKAPQTLTATVNTAGIGLRLIFAADPEIEDGEEVYIYPQNGGLNQVSAICTVTRTTGNTFTVVGVQTTPMTASGTYVVIRYYRTLSLIGYAQKNDIIDTWSYTDLLRSNKLNFRLYKQIQGALDVTSNGILYDWTDYLNTLRRLIYSGEIIENGFLTTYNSEAIYDLDTIGLESVLQLGVNTSKVTLAVATSTGTGGRTGYSVGAKNEGCYAAFVVFETNDGARSSYSKASNVLWLRSEAFFEHKGTINSKRAIQITIEQIPIDLFDYVQVGIIEFTNDSWKGYSLPKIPINGQETIYVGDNGLNPQSYLDFNHANTLLEQIPFVFENARCLLNYNSYLIAGNVNLYQQYDLNDWAQGIGSTGLTVVRREITLGTYANIKPPQNFFSSIFLGVNDYSRCSNIWMSYMPHDTYRFCIFIDWMNGMPTSTYWMADKSFAPIDTGLTDDVCAVSGADLVVYQYYLEVTGINLNYVLPNGKLLRDEVKDIRFGRTLVNPKVQTTGLGIAVFNGLADYISSFNDGANVIDLNKLGLFSPDYQNTGQVFNWQLGDYLLATQAWEGDTFADGVNNQAFAFDRNAASDQVITAISALQNSETGGDNSIASFSYATGLNPIKVRGAAAVSLNTLLKYDDMTDGNVCQNFYYIRDYGSDGAYPISPQQTRFFVIPQNQWFDKETHTSATVYELYGGDCFPTPSAYKTAENSSTTGDSAAVVFWSFNRTNTVLRSGSFPQAPLNIYLFQKFLTAIYFTDYPYDIYTYENVFTPVYLFQNQVAFNGDLPQYLNKFSSLYYSGKSFGSDLAGGNRIWLPLDMKTLETKYGAIVDIDVLLGQTGTNILIVLQERRLTAQYFDNTANIKSNTGELLIGNGAILARDGQNFTEFGCEHKWTAVKGQTSTGKDVKYWLCLRKTAIMRFGADGTSNIIGNIAPLIENKAILGLANGYNNDDAPALFNGCHAVWDNKRMEYILTLRLYPKVIDFGINANIGEFKESPTLKWGFEQFPVIYESLIDNNSDVPPSINWRTHSGYDSDYFEVLTIVWNEENNVFKTYRTYSPKIYGQFNDNYVSSHPTEGNIIFEHNDINNEAIYYGIEYRTETEGVTTDPELFRINGAGIESNFPSPFVPYDRQKYIVTIQGKNYEIVGTGTDYLQMANIDSDDILPQATLEPFRYSIVNCQDPYITGLCNNPEAKYFHFEQKTVQADSALKRVEYEAGFNGLGTAVTKGFSVKAEEKYQNGTFDTQIRQDTTNNPTDNTLGKNKVEGVWMKFKNIFRWGKNNKVLITIIKAIETQKTK